MGAEMKRLLFTMTCAAAAVCLGKVFDDATCLHYGMDGFPSNPAKNTNYNCYPDYRHYSTFGTGTSHNIKVTSDNSIVNLSAATSDVYSPTLGRTLSGESCLKIDQTINAGSTTNYSFGSVNMMGTGIPSTSTNYTVLIRFRPNMKDLYANGVGDWWRLAVLSATWRSATKAGRGFYAGLVPQAGGTNGCICVQNGGMQGNDGNVNFGKVIAFDAVWNELAIIVSNDTVRVGICNEKINPLAGDSRMIPYPGQWVWQTKTFTPLAGSGSTWAPNASDYLSFGRDGVNQSKPSSYRGDVHMVAMWNRCLDSKEVYEAFAAGHTPLFEVGFEKDGAAAQAFTGDPSADATLDSDRPWNWHNLPTSLQPGRRISLGFTVQPWHMNATNSTKSMSQVVRLYSDAASTANASVSVAIDSKEHGTAILRPGASNCQVYIREGELSQGAHTLTITRTDNSAGTLVLAGFSAEGSWRVGDNDSTWVKLAYTMSDNMGKAREELLPYQYDVVDGCWRDCSGFVRNSWSQPGNSLGSQQGSSRVRFFVPQEMYDAGYSYDITFDIINTNNQLKRQDNNEPRGKWAINGVTNRIDSATPGTFTYRLSRDAGNLRAGANVLEVIDDDVIYNTANNSYYNNWLQIDYYMMKVVNFPRGMKLILR